MALRVAMFTLEFPPMFSGGLGVHVAGLAEYLRARGDTVDVFFVGASPAPPRTIPLPAFEACQVGAEIDAQRVPGSAMVLSRHAARPYDVAHCHDWHGALQAALLQQRGVPLITTCHLPAASQFHYPGERAVEFAALLESLALRLSSRVIAVSRFVASEIERKHRAFAGKIRVILNGTDTDAFNAVPGFRQPLILAAGRLTPQKGFLELLKIFTAVNQGAPQSRLRILGSGPDERMLRDSIMQSEAAGATELLPFCRRNALRAHYQQARVLAVPSAYEPFGLVAIEAMACATPVVAYATGGLSEIVDDGINGHLVAPGDRRSFASVLIALIKHPAWAACLGLRARQTAVDGFRDEASYARTRAVYEA
jgi:glycosyltransferase involved in cell wall biosynthesis